MDRKKLLLVDGFSLLYRAFYGTRFLSTTDGRPTNALYGFCAMVFKLMDEFKPDAILVALDSPGKTFRHVEFEAYKGTRKEMPEEMKVQIPIARELIGALAIPQIELISYEADDIIGTLSLQAESNGYETLIITGDLDSLQLVDECVHVVTPRTGASEVTRYDREAVIQRFGFGPEFMTDYKSLAGDSSDNIPGVPGIGDKSATALIQKFGHIEEMLARYDEVEEKYKKKIDVAKDKMIQSKWLATIDRHVPIEWDFAPYRLSSEQLETGVGFMEQLEFRNFVKRLPTILSQYTVGATKAVTTVVEESIEANSIQPPQNFEAYKKWLAEKPYALYFTGQRQPSMFDESSFDQAFVARGNDVFAVDAKWAIDAFRERPEQACTHDSKTLYNGAGKILAAPGFDSMLAGYVLQSGRSHYELTDLVQGYLDVVAPKSNEAMTVGLYRLRAVMEDRLAKEQQTKVLTEIEQPLVPILARMEDQGITVRSEFLQDFSKSLSIEIERLETEIYELAGQKFLIGSPKQLGEILFEKLQIPGGKKSKTGYSTGAEVLQTLVVEYPITMSVLNWRELSKLKNTYADSLPKMIGPDGRIHTRFNQTVAATGRLSSVEPNLQNIPIRTELGRQIRRAFVAPTGSILGSFDYSQIELRLLAHLCQDPVLVDAFQKRVDVHTVTASLMFHVDEPAVTKDQRRLAKMLNYAVLYGVTDYGLAQQLGGDFSVSEAKNLITEYYARFPTVKAFTDHLVEDARAKGFTTTIVGRRRYFPDIHAANRATRLYAERQAINAPIQGAAADMIKLAMLHVGSSGDTEAVRMLLQVHDELVFELDEKSYLDQVEPLRTTMENAMPISVPVEVDAKFGGDWNQMEVIEVKLAR